MQARVLRQRKEMSQKDLAIALHTSQNAIYRLENPKYGRPSISTLRKLATFFDVGLVVRFAPFGELVRWTTSLSESSINVADFETERAKRATIEQKVRMAVAAGLLTHIDKNMAGNEPSQPRHKKNRNIRQRKAMIQNQPSGVSSQMKLPVIDSALYGDINCKKPEAA